jgi:four helix bundle protein
VISRASVFECVAIIDLLVDQNKITDFQSENLINLADELSRMLYKMISNLGNPQSS